MAGQTEAFGLADLQSLREDGTHFHVVHAQRGKFSLPKADMHPELQDAIRSIAKGKQAAVQAIQNTPGPDGVTRAADGSLASQMADLQRADPQGPVPPDDSPAAGDNPNEPLNKIPPNPGPDLSGVDTTPVSQIDSTLSSNQPDSEAARAFRQGQKPNVDSGMTPGEDPIGINNYLRNPVSSAPDEDAKRDVIAAELKKHGYPTRDVDQPDMHEDLVNGGYLVSNPKEKAEVAQHFADYQADQKLKYLKLHPNASPEDLKVMGFGDTPAAPQKGAPAADGGYSDPASGGFSENPGKSQSSKNAIQAQYTASDATKKKPGKKPPVPEGAAPTNADLDEFDASKAEEQHGVFAHAHYIDELGQKQANVRDAYLKDAEQAKFDHDLKMHNYEVKAEGRMNWIRKHPLDANRYWHDMGTGPKIANIIALALGGVSQSLTGQANPAQQILDKTIDRDVKSQMASRDDANTSFGQYMQLGHSEQSAYQLARSEAKDVLAGQLASVADRMAGTEAGAKALQEVGRLRAEAVAERQTVSANDFNLKMAQLRAPYELQAKQLQRDLLRAQIAQYGAQEESRKKIAGMLTGETGGSDNPLDDLGEQGVISKLAGDPSQIPAHTIRFPKYIQNQDGSYSSRGTQTRLARVPDKDGKLQDHVDKTDKYLRDVEDYDRFLKESGVISGGPIDTAKSEELDARNAALTFEVQEMAGFKRLSDTDQKLILKRLGEGGWKEAIRNGNDPKIALLKKLGYDEINQIETNHLFRKRR